VLHHSSRSEPIRKKSIWKKERNAGSLKGAGSPLCEKKVWTVGYRLEERRLQSLLGHEKGKPTDK